MNVISNAKLTTWTIFTVFNNNNYKELYLLGASILIYMNPTIYIFYLSLSLKDK